MITISENIVEEVWQAAKEWSDDDMAKVVGDMSDDQPLLMAYLISAGEKLLNDVEQELMFFFGILLWQMMSKGATDEEELPEMNEAALAAAEENNARLMGFFDDQASSEMRKQLNEILASYNQPNLLNFVVEVVVEALEDGDIEMASYGPMILYLKVVIDGLDN
jgi:hypothetical protein